MLELPPALAALRAYRQFIIYKIVPSTSRPGKTDKLPLDYRTGRVADAHDPTIWLDFDSAAVIAAGDGHGVGFVFTLADPFWFIDIDDCLSDLAEWSPTALALMARLAGCAVEVSQSGRGLHLFGKGVAPKPRKIKYGQWFDLYTENRFVALTGDRAGGDANTDHTPALAQLVAEYLTPDASEWSGWTVAPVPEWRGNTDDQALINRALHGGSAAQRFGTKASFKELWEADAAALGKYFPDAHRPYDASLADSSLAQSLAFWTGKDCERIQRIMRMSALVRPKWDREDYLPRTIIGCVSRQYDVLQDKPPEALPAIVAVAPNAPRAKLVTGDTFLSIEEQIETFKGCVYVADLHRALIPGGYLLKPDQFKAMYGGYSFPLDPMNEKVSRNAWEALLDSQAFRVARADSTCFRPDLPPATLINNNGTMLANTWWPIDTPQSDGDPSPFTNHLAKLLPAGDDCAILTAYLAAIVQYPGSKFQWAPLIQGIEGNGKTLITTAITRAVGERYSHAPNTEDLLSGGAKFTAWLRGKLFIALEEIYTGDRRNMLEVLKPLITNSRVEIQAKGQDQYTGDNVANFIACSNHKDAIPKSSKDRRWCIFYTAQQYTDDLRRDGMDGSYMPDLWNWFEGRGAYKGSAPGYAIITGYLKKYVIPDALNPASGMHRAPETSSTDEAIQLSVGAIEQEVLEAIAQEISGFAGGWVSSMAFDKLLVRLNAERRIPPRKRHELLVGLGYQHHPALNDGRVNSSVSPDGGKPRLYVRVGHPINAISNPVQVAKIYEQSQSAALAGKANFGT